MFLSRLDNTRTMQVCILSTKIEVHLAKAEPINWTYLEYDKKQVVP
jgi:hypothetical protein